MENARNENGEPVENSEEFFYLSDVRAGEDF